MKLLEKLAQSKINTVADWLIRVVVLNVMMIIASLPLLTIIPALSAGYNMFTDAINNEEKPLVKGYIMYFKENFMKKFSVNLVFILSLIILTLNTVYYISLLETHETLFYLIGYYISILLLVGLGLVMLYTLAVLNVYPRLKLKLLFKLAFFLAGKYFLKTLALLLSIIIPFGMLLAPFTFMLFVFSGISIAIIINVLLTRQAVGYMESLGDNHDQSGN